jgi:hypothetical protein
MDRRLTYNSDAIGWVCCLKPFISRKQMAEEPGQALKECGPLLPEDARMAAVDANAKRLKDGIRSLRIILPREAVKPFDDFIRRTLPRESHITDHRTPQVLGELVPDRTQCSAFTGVVWADDEYDVALCELERRTVAESDLINPSSGSHSHSPLGCV